MPLGFNSEGEIKSAVWNRASHSDRPSSASFLRVADHAPEAAEGLVSHKDVARTQLRARRIQGLARFETLLRQADRERECGVVYARKHKSKPIRRARWLAFRK